MTTSSSEELIARMRKASVAIYLATDASVADDISGMLTRAAAALEAAQADLAARDAVISEACTVAMTKSGKAAARVLATPPGRAIDAVKARAWDAGAERVITRNKAFPLVVPIDNPYRTTPTEGATT